MLLMCRLNTATALVDAGSRFFARHSSQRFVPETRGGGAWSRPPRGLANQLKCSAKHTGGTMAFTVFWYGKKGLLDKTRFDDERTAKSHAIDTFAARKRDF